MNYFVKVKRGERWLKPFGPIGSLKDADVIARHESRESNTEHVLLIDDTGTTRREYSAGKVYSPNPAKRSKPKSKPTRFMKNPQVSNAGKKFFIVHEHREGVLYYDGIGFSKLKSSAVNFQSAKNAVARGKQIADLFKVRLKVIVDA